MRPTLFFTVFIMLLGASIAPFSVHAANNADVQLEVPLPGIENVRTYDKKTNTLQLCNNGSCTGIQQYVITIYKWLTGIAAFLAIAALTYAGIVWLTAGGNSGQVDQARTIIMNALTGLALALGSFTILALINPKLVEFGAITPTGIGSREETNPPAPPPASKPVEVVPTTAPTVLPLLHTNYCCGYVEQVNQKDDLHKSLGLDSTDYIMYQKPAGNNEDDCTSIPSDQPAAFDPALANDTDENYRNTGGAIPYQFNTLKKVLYCRSPLFCPGIDGKTGVIANGGACSPFHQSGEPSRIPGKIPELSKPIP